MPAPVNQPTGIITRRYKHGSIVYFENDKSEFVYILKGGRVVLTSRKLDTGEEVKEEIKPGEFFGVKSSLGKYPREETAQTIGETVLLVLTLADFERMVLQNVNVVRKMLRIFSNQLRRINKMQREVLGEGESVNPKDELFKIGEYYYKVGRAQQALFAFKRYMEHYPDGKYSSAAMQRIREIEAGGAGGPEYVPIAETAQAPAPGPAPAAGAGMDMTDFSIEDDRPAGGGDALSGFGAPSAAKSSSTSLSSEMDDFFSSGKPVDVDNISFDEPGAGAGGAGKDVAEMFYEAMSKFSQESFDEAERLYTAILNVKNLRNESEKKIFEKAHFEIGRCYLKLGKTNEALTALSNMIKKFPNSDNVRNALLHIGICYEMAKKNDKAVTYYNKVASLDPKDSVTKLAVKRLKAIQNGGR